jgi:class 3 adenylate cyclase
MAQGYATLGQIGFADRSGYTAIGTVCNRAARLSGEAKDGQILATGRLAAAVQETTAQEDIGPVVLKGLTNLCRCSMCLKEVAPGSSATTMGFPRPAGRTTSRRRAV